VRKWEGEKVGMWEGSKSATFYVLPFHLLLSHLFFAWYNMSYQYDDRHNHAYNYWHSVNDDPFGGNECVSQQVVEFLQAHP
jgi:hypothetical protein